jgi:four helix bundle protein
MSQIKPYKDLLVWQKAIVLVTDIYKETQSFPAEERYGLTSQIRRSAVSVPSNIAEGYGRNSTGDYKRFLQVAVGSLYELQTQLEISLKINLLKNEVHNTLFEKTAELDRMLYSLINKIN